MEPLFKHLKIRRTSFIILLLAILSLMTIFAAPAQAAVVTWMTGTSANWNTAAAWDTGVVPTSTDDVVIPASAGDVVTVNANVSALSISVGSGSTLAVQSTSPSPFTLTVTNGIINNGTVTIAGGFGTGADANLLAGTGFANFGALSMSKVDVGFATLTVPSGSFVNNAGATITDAGSAQSGSTINADLLNQGVLNVARGITLSRTAGVFSSTGTISIAAGASLTVQNGTLTNNIGGVLEGGGQLTTSNPSWFNNYGTIRPGGAGAPGTLSLYGNTTNYGTIETELYSSQTGSYDQITAMDQLGGSYVSSSGIIKLVSLYTPTVGDTFIVIDAGAAAIGGGFVEDYPVLGNQKNWLTTINPTNVTVSVIADTTPPFVTGADTLIPRYGPLTVTFSELMDPASISVSTFLLTDSVGSPVAGTVVYKYDPFWGTMKAFFEPSTSLMTSASYTATITTGATDLAGVGLSADYVWTVTTLPGMAYVSQAPPNGTIIGIPFDGLSEMAITAGNNPRLSPDGRYLVFQKDPLGSLPIDQQHIYVRDLFTGQETPVVTNDSMIINYAWMNDSYGIVFDYAGGVLGACGMHRINRDGTGAAQIAGFNCGDLTPSVSPPGAYTPDRIAFSSTVDGVGYANADGSGVRTIIPNTLSGGLDQWPAWSPDGLWISLQRYNGIALNYFKIRPDGTGLTQLTFAFQPGLDTFPAGVWTPDGTTLVTSGLLHSENSMVWTYAIPADGSGNIGAIYAPSEGNGGEFVGGIDGNVSAPDNIRPQVMIQSPANGAVDVPTTSVIKATFNEVMNDLTIDGTSFTLLDSLLAQVSGTVTYDPATRTATFSPASRLNNNETYSIVFTSAVTDPAGNMIYALGWSFTTAAKNIWTGSTGGVWTDTAFWTLNTVPTNTHEVEINDGGCINCTITINVPAVVSRLDMIGTGATMTLSLAANSLVIINGGSVSTNGTILQSGGILTLDGPMTIAGTYTQAGGTMNGNGTLDISGIYTLSGGGTLVGPGITNVSGILDITGSAVLDARTLNLSGTGTMAAAGIDLTFGNGAVFNNLSGAVFDLQTSTPNGLQSAAGGGVFNNQAGALFKRSAGAGIASVNSTFNNSGAVDVQSGGISLGGALAPNTHDGSFVVSSAAATLQFSGGVHTLTSTASVTGIGTVDFSNTSSTSLASGATYTGVGTTSVTGGAVDFSNGTVSTANLVVSGGTMTGTATVIAVNAGLSGGMLGGAGVTNVSGTLDITGSAVLDKRALNLSGTGAMTGIADLTFGNGAVFNNQSGAAFDLQSSGGFNSSIGGGTFNNLAGALFTRSAGGIASIYATFNNFGAVDIQTGGISLGGAIAPNTHAGSFVVSSATSTLQFFNGVHTLTSTASVTGSGTVDFTNISTTILASGATYTGVGTTSVTGGVVDFSNGTVSTANLVVSGGTMTGTATVNTALAALSGGMLGGAGITNVNGMLNITGSTGLNSRTLNMSGTGTMSGATDLIFGNGAVFNNGSGSVFDLQTSAGSGFQAGAGSGTFNNQAGALFIRSAGGGAASVAIPFNNSGTVDIQAASAQFTSTFANPLGSILQGSGGIDVSASAFTTAGSIFPGAVALASTLTFTGDLPLSSTSFVDMDITGLIPGSQYDQIAVSQTATLTGTLNVIFSAFTPTAGNSFTLLTCGTACSGTFSNVVTSQSLTGAYLSLVYNPTSVVLSTLTDSTPPTGTVVINGGSAFTNSTVVNLALTCTDPESGCTTMDFSNDGTSWSGAETFQTIKSSWTISAGDGLKTVYVRFTDLAGNVSSNVTAAITLDTVGPVFSGLSPAPGSVANSTVGYSLNELVTSGTVTYTWVSGPSDTLSPHGYALVAGDMTVGSHSINTGLPLVDGAVYDIDLNGIDQIGNAGSAVISGITYDGTAPVVTLNSPLASSTTNTTSAAYTLSEMLSSGSIVYTATSGTDAGSPHTYPLTGPELDAGAHGVLTNLPLVDGVVYTVSLANLMDVAGNPTGMVSQVNVAYDISSVAITAVAPTASGVISSPTVTYTLSEQAASGTITFTWTGGALATDQTYTMSAPDLSAGVHSVDTGLPLVDNAIYTMTITAMDMVGNPATNVTNAGVLFDSQHVLAVSPAGTGSGTVTSDIPGIGSGISCGAACSDTYPHGATIVLTATPNASSVFSGWTGGGCSGTGTCTIPAISTDITVTAAFTLAQYTVTASAGAGGTINPASALVTSGSTTTFTVTPNTGYTALVGGTCGGTLVGTVYTTNAITADCTVIATFTLNTYTITTSVTGSGTISPVSAIVSHGTATDFTLTPGTGYSIGTVGGTCGGTLAGSLYTTSVINGPCTVIANFILNDVTAPVFSALSPASSSLVNTAQVGYSLSELATSGTITFTRVGGTADPSSPHGYTLTTGDLTAGPHSINTGLILVSGAVYDIGFSATDASGNTGGATITTVTYDSTAASVVITAPLPNTATNTTSVSYTLSEAITAAELVYTAVSGTDPASPQVYPLSGVELTSGGHTVIPGISLVNGTVYDISFQNVIDLAGNPTAPIANMNVTYDTTAIVVTNIAPLTRSIIIDQTVNYVLSEDAGSGTITFTRSGGNPDSGSPHVFTGFISSELFAGTHAVNTGFPLSQGTFYTVTVQFTDRAGNPSPTVSESMIFHDPDYGVGAVGNVDNSTPLVDDADVAKMQSVLGAYPGDPNWNPVCDLDKNNVVDQKDLMILLLHYGQ